MCVLCCFFVLFFLTVIFRRLPNEIRRDVERLCVAPHFIIIRRRLYTYLLIIFPLRSVQRIPTAPSECVPAHSPIFSSSSFLPACVPSDVAAAAAAAAMCLSRAAFAVFILNYETGEGGGFPTQR